VDEPRLQRLLGSLCGHEATDLLLKAGSPPKVRCKGVLEAVPNESPLTRADVDDAALAMLGAAPAVVLDGQRAVTYTVDGLGRFRVGAFRQRGSTAIVVRRTPDRVATIDALGLPAQAREFAEVPQGLVLVVGRRHSGRRRTLASMLDHVNHVRAAHIVAVEQRVELLHPDAMASVSQLEVGNDVPSFGDGVRAARLADADVVVISDVVDDDTATELVRAAEDGAVVLAGMDAIAGVDALERLVGLFPANQHDRFRLSLSGVLVGTLAQRLASRAAGHGRVPVVEVILNSPEVTSCLFDEKTVSDIDEIVECSGHLGMQSFSNAAAELLMAGTIDLRGLLSVIDDWPRVHRVLVDTGVLSR
jgi:twitching motility protein PilT